MARGSSGAARCSYITAGWSYVTARWSCRTARGSVSGLSHTNYTINAMNGRNSLCTMTKPDRVCQLGRSCAKPPPICQLALRGICVFSP